jgi:EAL domain-containing protein (putative c-di-GMP-specific phosphodiesterase class I)
MTSAPTTDRRQADAQFERILDARELRIVFQPIVHLPTETTVGYEALVRGPEDSLLASPAALLAAANRAGRLVEFDWAARSRACRAALEAELSSDQLLFLNIEPIALDSACPPDLWPDIERGFSRFRVVLEVTERSLDRDPGSLLDGIERQRPVVAGIALDDVGPLPATLAMLPLAAPTVIKIDGSMLAAAPNEELSRVLNAVHGQADRTGALVLAEGIETVEHRGRAVAYGAQLGQGHLFGRAGPLARGDGGLPHHVPLVSTPPLIVRRPFEALAGHAIGPAGDELVAELTRYVAATADVSAPTVHVNLLVGADRLDSAELERLSHLARRGTFAAVLGPGIAAEPGHGVRGTGQRREPLPAAEWACVSVGPGFCAAVLARRRPDEPGVWEYGITQDWPRTIAATRSLVRLLGAPEPSFRYED